MPVLVFGAVLAKYTVADIEVSFRATHMPYTHYMGMQSDILRESMYVFNDLLTFGNFLSTVPSMDGVIPSFDENRETLVVVVSKSEPCVYLPKISAIYPQTWLSELPNRQSILVSIAHEAPSNEDNVTCEPNNPISYIYNIVIVEKTNLPVSLEMPI